MSFLTHQLRRRVAVFVARFARTIVFTSSVAATALLSSCYTADTGTSLTTEAIGSWVTWPAAGQPDQDPYTRLHFARLGALPLNADSSLLFTARVDADGSRLHSSCDYTIEGRGLPTHWWSLTAFTENGQLIANPAERYAFTSDTVSFKSDGTFEVTLARDARPGNWLPTGGAGRLVMTFQLIDLGIRALAREDGSLDRALPIIKRSRCR
jgi:hypothetical protein